MSASASRDTAGKVHVSLANIDPSRAITLECRVSGAPTANVTGKVLTAPLFTAHNTFAAPNTVVPQPFTGATQANGVLRVVLPAKSVVA